jgi:rhamnulokinase
MLSNKISMLAFDLGAESGRAILGQLENNKLSLTEIHRFSNQPVSLPDGLHWDILSLFKEIKYGLTRAAQTVDRPISSIGIDTWGVDFGLLDRQDVLIGNPYHYRDSRTDGMVEKVLERVPKDQIFAQTGEQFLQFNTLYQLYAMVLSRSPALDAAETLLTTPDLLNFWLTGQKVCEYTIATTTQCYDSRRESWAKPILERLSIPTHIFPKVVQPGTILGEVLPGICEECGLQQLKVIAPACHDTGSAVGAVPATGSNFAWISSGTWSIMGVESPAPVINNQSLAYNFANEGGINHTIRVSRNIMGLWLIQESRRTWARHGKEYSYDDLTHLAAEAKPLRSLIDPDFTDFLKPGDMPARIQAYCKNAGQPIPETPGEIVRCCLESIALRYRWILERLEALQGHPVDTIHIVGGGTRNHLLSQLAADATNRPVVAGPIEATAIGNLLVQAISTGMLSSLSEARSIVRSSFEVVTYEPSSNRNQWDEAYQLFNKIIQED